MSNRVVEYIIRAKDATKHGIQTAIGRVQGFAKSVATNLANIQSGLSMAMGAVQKFTSAFARAIAEAFKFEKAQSDFKVLLGSIDKAKSHLADLRSFAASTPLSFEDLAKSSKLLLSFGVSVESIMPSMKMLGDIAMGDAQKFQGLSLVFAQVQSAGKLMGQDLLQMINQGFNPLTIISQQTGKSMSELKDMMGEGAISFEMVAEAMRIATSEGGLFNNAMAESAKTGEGMVSTLKDNWTEAVRTFGEAFSDSAKNGIGLLSEKISELTEDGTIEQWAERVADSIYSIGDVARGVGSFLNKIWDGVKGTVGTAMAFAAGADQAVREGKSFKEQIAAGKVVASEYWNREFNGGALEELRSEREMLRGKKKKIAKSKSAPASPVKSLEEMMSEATAESEAKAKAEAEKKAKAAEEAARKAAAAEEKERLRIENEIAKERDRLLKAEMETYKRDLTAAHEAAQKVDADAQTRLARAQEASARAWGWYRDKDSLRAQLEEERADAEAQIQFEKDFERLKSKRSDWRTADAFGSGKMRALSLDEEATRRVALAREEEAAALQYAKETAENTRALAEKLEELTQMREA